MIRSFEWRDLPTLHRYRNSGLFLDSALLLTRGAVLVPAGAMLAYLAPATGIYTYVSDQGGRSAEALFAQISHTRNASYARLSFLAPETGLESLDLPALLDYLAREIGERGAFHILAEVDECSLAYQVLRQAGFAIYARQSIWRLEGETRRKNSSLRWRNCTPSDLIGVRTLYNNLVPGLVQQAEPLPRGQLRGLVHEQDGEIKGYIELRYGLYGIWAQPFIHPDAEELPENMVRLLYNLPNRGSRPVYVCIRSYQSWLETAIEPSGASARTVQAVLVRHLALPRRASEPYTVPAINGTRTEPVARIVNSRQLTAVGKQSLIWLHNKLI